MVAIVHLDLGVMESTTVKVLAVGFSSYIIIYFGVSLRVIVKFETLLTIFSSSSPPCFSSLSLSLYLPPPSFKSSFALFTSTNILGLRSGK